MHGHEYITIDYCPTDEMIGDFFTKPVGGTKFHLLFNIIMNISHDEYGPVDVDALMAVHNEKMQKRTDVISQHKNEYDDKPTISKSSNPTSDVDLQESVGNVTIAPNDTISAQKRNNASRAAIGCAQKISKKNNQRNKGNMSGIVQQCSYADVAVASS